MLKIGILGSDNSHALNFAKMVNLKNEKTGDYLYPDIKITSIFGLDKERTKQVAEEGKIEFIAEKPQELMGKADTVMVVFRHGDLHAPYALPFIKKGYPVWIDKPFTIKTEDSMKLFEEADKAESNLYGGSSLRYAYDILTLKNMVENSEGIGGISSGAINFPADLESEYGGLFFYGGHLSEMLLTVFGYDINSVTSNVKNGNIITVAKYDKYDIVMYFLKNNRDFKGILYTGKKTVVRDIDISMIHKFGFEDFIKMLKSGEKFPREKLIKPVILLNAIQKSIDTGKEVMVSEIEKNLNA